MLQNDILAALDMLYGDGGNKDVVIETIRDGGPNEILMDCGGPYAGRLCRWTISFKRLPDRTQLQFLVETRRPA